MTCLNAIDKARFINASIYSKSINDLYLMQMDGTDSDLYHKEQSEKKEYDKIACKYKKNRGALKLKKYEQKVSLSASKVLR